MSTEKKHQGAYGTRPKIAYFKTAVRFALAFGWLYMGFYVKILDMVPRHRMIAARVVGEDFAHPVILTIGVLEVILAIWLLSNYRPILCAVMQTGLLAVMNAYELSLASDLLLLGKGHIFVTLLCVGAIWFLAIKNKSRKG